MHSMSDFDEDPENTSSDSNLSSGLENVDVRVLDETNEVDVHVSEISDEDDGSIDRRSGRASSIMSKAVEKIRTTVTAKLLVLIWAVFLLQFVAYPFFVGPIIQSGGEQQLAELWKDLFVLDIADLGNFWTYVTSMFSHGGLFHVLVNSIVLLSFGLTIEDDHSTKDYLTLFFTGGFVASISQVFVTLLAQEGVAGLSVSSGSPTTFLGASGAIAAIIGVTAIKYPDSVVYLFFMPFLKMPSFYAITLFIVGSSLAVVFGGVGAFGTAHTAHIGGIIAGILWGVRRYGTDSVKSLLYSTANRIGSISKRLF